MTHNIYTTAVDVCMVKGPAGKKNTTTNLSLSLVFLVSSSVCCIVRLPARLTAAVAAFVT